MANDHLTTNHLIIGLGGTGGKILRELRKRVYEEFHANEPTNHINLEYIYVDSSPADLNDRSGWKVMGKSVHLKEAQKVSIHGISAGMFQNLSMYPGINSFLTPDDIDLMTSKLGPLITAGIGGQRRRLGRTLFANNLSVKDGNSDFVSRIKQAVQRITTTDEKVDFHICAGLAGGTGSGSIVDAIAQIRKEFAPHAGGDKYKVYLYLYIPEINVVTPSHDAGFYQANGYAALCELNAMSTGYYLPYDITGKKDNYTGEVQRLLQGINAFEAAYLYTNINEAGKVLDIGQGLPMAVADFMFQKIIAAGMTSQGQMSRLVGCENDGAGAENNQANEPTRSRKFLSFGIKRIEYPETEIEEFVTYNFARQATRQLTYNLWQEGIGYGECSIEEIGTGFATDIAKKETRETLKLANSYLTLSKPIIESPATRRWDELDSTWENRTQRFADEVQTGADKKSWFREFTEACMDYYDDKFRGHGVKKFYDLQRNERPAYAKHIRRHIESLLFNDWHKGTKSILEVEKYIRLLINNCEQRCQGFKDQISKLETELDDINTAINKCNEEWKNIGWLRDAITGVSKKVLSAYKTAKCNYYTNQTYMEAYRYADELMQDIVVELGRMLDGVVAYQLSLDNILEEVNKQADSRCRKSEKNDDNKLKKYDIDAVHQFTKNCTVNHDTQKANAATIRNHMVEQLGDDGERSFINLFDRIDYESMTDIILDVCQTNARAAMNDTAKNDPLNKMIGVNILEKLKQECNSEEKLEQFVRSVVTSAMTYLQFNNEEKAKVFNDAPNSMMTMIQLCLPKFDNDKSGFREKLIDMFTQVYPGFNPKEDVAENYKNNQIVVVAAAAGFPLRYVTNVKVLKQRYDDLMAAPDKVLNRMVLHTESFAKPLPELFEMEKTDIQAMVTKPVMLGYAMGIFEEKSDPVTGERFHAVNFPDEFGDANWVKTGKNILHTIEVLANDYALAKRILALIEQKLKTEYRSNTQKAALRKAVAGVVKTHILPHPVCENNEFSPVYAHYKNLARQLFDNELKDL